MQAVFNDFLVAYNHRRLRQGRSMKRQTTDVNLPQCLPKPQPQKEEMRTQQKVTKQAA